MTQNDSESTFKIAESDGYKYGTLTNITIDSMGRIIGIYSNGMSRIDAILAISDSIIPAGCKARG